MGKGNDPNCRGAASTAGAMVIQRDNWLSAGGPEATAEELDAYLDSRAGWKDDPESRQLAHRSREDPDFLCTRGMFASRRSLEAVLAALHGQDLTDYRATNAERPWSELSTEAIAAEKFGGTSNADYMARLTEKQLRAAGDADSLLEQCRAKMDSTRAPIDPPDWMGPHLAKLGPGTQSGRLEDYSRAELRKLLGFLERDSKHLTDEDLRGMALAAHLVPRWKTSPSHRELALRDAARWFRSSPDYAVKKFKRALRTPYGKLAGRSGDDTGRVPPEQLFDRLAARNPLLAASGTLSASQLYGSDLAAYVGGVGLPEEQRNTVAEGAATRAQTSLELSFEPAFRSFAAALPGTSNLTSVKPGLGKHRRCYGLYEPSSGTIYIHSALVKVLDQAKQGKAQPAEIEQAVSTVAHELLHAQEGRDEGNRQTGRANAHTAQHTLDEGATEALARLHTDDLARRMGLWAGEDSLREHARSGSYDREVETTVALTAAVCGELDLDRLRAGEYAQPEALSAPARHQLLELHTRHGVAGRMMWLSDRIVERTGKNGGEAIALVTEVLRECKHNSYQWRRRRMVEANGNSRVDHVAPSNISERLAELLGALT
jgi:hypothetical protein